MVGLLRPASYFLWRVCPPYRPKCPKMGVQTRARTHFFAAWLGPTRERMVRSTPPPRSGAEGKFFTPKAYLHTSFCVQKMGDPELSFRLHRVLFCVEHKSTLDYVGLCRYYSVLQTPFFGPLRRTSTPVAVTPPSTPHELHRPASTPGHAQTLHARWLSITLSRRA